VSAVDLGQVSLRHVVLAFVPIPIGFALIIAGIVTRSTTLLFVALAFSALAMPVGGYAAARLFHELTDPEGQR